MNETQHDIQVFYKKIVEIELGSIADVDKDGDIFFNVPDAGQFYILLEKNDPSHFRMGVFSVISRKEFGLSLTELLETLNEFNSWKKVAKHWVRKKDDDHLVCITAEAFLNSSTELPDEKVLRATIERYFRTLNNGARELVDHLREQASEAEQKQELPHLAGAEPTGSV